MNKSFRTYYIRDIGKVSMCKRVLKEETFEDEEIPFYKISTFGGKADTFISRKHYQEYRDKYSFPKVGEILISAAGTIGKTVIYNGEDGYFQDSNIVWVENDQTKVRNDYLYYFFQTKPWFTTHGSTITRIYNENLRSIKLNVPESLSEQQKIASVLSALDSKIELNNRINDELEVIVKTLYDYWFVQFDFPDKKGKPYKTSGGKMVWSEELKRDIPEGWEVESIERCCSIIDCLHSKKSDKIFEDERYYLLQLENIKDDGLIDLTNKYYVTKAEYNKWTTRIEVIDGDIVITNAGRVAATAQIPNGIKAGIGRNITAIRPVSINPTYLFLSFRGADIKRQIKLNTDSGAFFTSFNVKGIKQLHILRPNNEIEEKFEKLVYPIRQKRELNNIENQKLTELRDWLLPMLMNGQIKIRDAKQESSFAIGTEDKLAMAAEPETNYRKKK
jgi:type I restriction enzyme S subunit